jgi:hypothetical protein
MATRGDISRVAAGVLARADGVVVVAFCGGGVVSVFGVDGDVVVVCEVAGAAV